jgi:2-keto-4-pentenoate hydratase/2-oxohepta-3-ene-1,7-dioic acid hydratase in catechol pathway
VDRGKGLDTFAPLGPFITTRDEIADVQNLKVEGLYNDQVTQSSNTSKMIFTIAYLVSYISQGITLEPVTSSRAEHLKASDSFAILRCFCGRAMSVKCA